MVIDKIEVEKGIVKKCNNYKYLERQMKRLVAIVLIAFSCTSYATTINVGDTTLASNWNAGGNVLNITGKISGAYQVSNAIIQANNFIQIFDTSVTLGTNIQCDKFSALWYGAKPSNQDNSVYLQKAINASQDRPYWLYIPGGIYNTSQPLMVIKGSYGSFQQTQIKMYGDATFWDNGTGTRIVYSGDSCALGMQLNKGSVVKGLWFVGKWVSPTFADSVYYSLTANEFTNQSVSGGNGNGIWIDPVGNWNQRSGSTGCQFLDLKIEKFTSLIKVGNGVSQNDEIMLFKNIQFGDAKYGIQSTQPQEKGNVIEGIYSWGKIFTIYQIPSGANYFINGANIAGGCVNIFSIQASGYFLSGVQNIYAENFGSIGTISSSLPIGISNSVFDFSTASKANLLSSGSWVKFDNCQFRFYGNSNPLKFSGGGTFDNCAFSGTVTGMSNPIFMSYTNGVAGVQNNQTITVTTDTVKSNYIKISLRKSYLSQ